MFEYASDVFVKGSLTIQCASAVHQVPSKPELLRTESTYYVPTEVITDRALSITIKSHNFWIVINMAVIYYVQNRSITNGQNGP